MTTTTRTSRPAEAIYLRNDKAQTWRECDSPYELGYAAGEADAIASCEPMTAAEHSDLWGNGSDYAEGYRDAYADARR